MSTRVIAYAAGRLIQLAVVVEGWLHLLVCASDQAAHPGSPLASIRSWLVAAIAAIRAGHDLDLHDGFADPVRRQALLDLMGALLQRVPAEDAPIPPMLQVSTAPDGGFWSSDLDFAMITSARIRQVGQAWVDLLAGYHTRPYGPTIAWVRERADVLAHTQRFRRSAEPLWLRLRFLLAQEGYDPHQLWLAELDEDGPESWCGVFLTPQRQVLMMVISQASGPTLAAEITGWHDCTDTWQRLPHRTAIRIALTLIDAGEQP